MLERGFRLMYAAGYTDWIYSYHHTTHGKWKGVREGDLWTWWALNLAVEKGWRLSEGWIG